jgi:hypothetical protein
MNEKHKFNGIVLSHICLTCNGKKPAHPMGVICEPCQGRGFILTDAGKELARFLDDYEGPLQEIKSNLIIEDDPVCNQCDTGYHHRCRGGDCGCGCNKRENYGK